MISTLSPCEASSIKVGPLLCWEPGDDALWHVLGSITWGVWKCRLVFESQNLKSESESKSLPSSPSPSPESSRSTPSPSHESQWSRLKSESRVTANNSEFLNDSFSLTSGLSNKSLTQSILIYMWSVCLVLCLASFEFYTRAFVLSWMTDKFSLHAFTLQLVLIFLAVCFSSSHKSHRSSPSPSHQAQVRVICHCDSSLSPNHVKWDSKSGPSPGPSYESYKSGEMVN